LTNISERPDFVAAQDPEGILNSCSKYLDENGSSAAAAAEGEKAVDGEKDNSNAGKGHKVRIIPIQIAKDHPSAATLKGRKISDAAPRSVDEDDDEAEQDVSSKAIGNAPRRSLGSGYASLPRRIHKKQVRSLIVPKMRRMFEKSKSAEPESPRTTTRTSSTSSSSAQSPPRRIKIVQEAANDVIGKNKASKRGDGTESVSSFVVLDQSYSAANNANDVTGTETIDKDDNTSTSEWSLSDEQPSDNGGRGFVNRCVSKVKSLVKQGSPQP